ncbi:MAG: hypothetical protein NWT04_13055 [Verrucomicrobiales bacterium]|nr:hypothetical protein [Verrucomicrobiales bacterium]
MARGDEDDGGRLREILVVIAALSKGRVTGYSLRDQPIVMRPALFAIVFSVLLFPRSEARAQAFNDFLVPPHDYGAIEGRDAMSRLVARAARGERDFGTETGLPLLRELLAELAIPESSQVLLFSKTSLQREYITPKTPRAIYFNENGYVSWVPDGLIEVLMFDPDAGGLFFLEELPEERPDLKTAFVKGRGCTGCHSGTATNFLPGPMARSAYVADDGRRIGAVPGHTRMHHGVPFADRWGGYYVSGAPLSLSHLGNAFASREGGETKLTRPGMLYDSGKYPIPEANVLPLMLFDHQIEGHNLLMEVRYRWRLAEYEKAKSGGEISTGTRLGLERGLERLVRYFLFANEAALDGAELVVSTAYREDFLRGRRMDGEGHSLKDLDLTNRLFKNRLSYLIYAQAFEEAPLGMREAVFARLHAILTPPEPPEGYAYFDKGERERIVSILRATRNDLPAGWHGGVRTAEIR